MNSSGEDINIDEDAPIYANENLTAIPPRLAPDHDPGPHYSPTQSGEDPSVVCLGFEPISKSPPKSNSGSEAALCHETIDHRGAMSEAGVTTLVEDGPPGATTKASQDGHDPGISTKDVDVAAPSTRADLRETAALAMRVGENGSPEDVKELAERPVHRVDSAQESSESVPQLTPEKRPQPLKLKTEPSNGSTPLAEDSITTSPTLRKHFIQVDDKSSGGLPPVQSTSPTVETSATSSRKESLPSFRQLADLADIASQQTQQDARPPAHHSHQHSHSFSSTTSQSPMIQYHPSYANSAQTSPVSSYHPAAYARSPTSTMGEGFYGSPGQNPGAAYYHLADRRTSVANENAHTYPTPVPSLPSNPSSGDSQVGNTSTDGYSTSHTTPIDPGSVPPDGMQRAVPILPPPPGMPPGMAAIIPTGGFTCDYPGCTALPFQTQYLLSSHRNVHSQSRPHYCPVKDCPRSEGGKGFKRKNEMIRHGLVHNSPGYICPFCPDREHKYPRPDNLQRHVRVHHVDKDRDDPALREVLAQRSEGAIQKQRRRRTQGSATLTREGENQVSESAA